ncbi:hypothetical protein DEU36_2906 [Microbacterium sp. AG238]|nr:hypothetical protein DEU36_2906 [Microbacterium sp. AG238]
MTPWDLIVWALAGAVALVILGIGLALAIGMITALRTVTK